jgi:nucleotide-binding universal stress UspA family protein
MKAAEAGTARKLAGTRINFRNILFLTDFSEPSEAALPFAMGIARGYGAKTFALNILRPDPLLYTTPESTAIAEDTQEETAKAEMARIESRLAGLPHETMVEWGDGIWTSVEEALQEHRIDLIVLGTHGRTGAEKLLLGSVAEEIFRCSPVPVLTIGPAVRSSVHTGARFRHVLFTTDFSPHSLAALPYALSLAEDNQARLTLLHIMKEKNEGPGAIFDETAAASVVKRLDDLLPEEVKLWCRLESVVEKGEPATRILEVAKQRGADLIVLGVRNREGHLGAATHLQRATAHKVVAHAECPVLTVRG